MTNLNLTRALASAWRITQTETSGGIKPIKKIKNVLNTLLWACHFLELLSIRYTVPKNVVWLSKFSPTSPNPVLGYGSMRKIRR